AENPQGLPRLLRVENRRDVQDRGVGRGTADGCRAVRGRRECSASQVLSRVAPPRASANTLGRGAGQILKVGSTGGGPGERVPSGRMAALKLSKEGLRLLRCTDLDFEGRATIDPGGGQKPFTIRQLLPSLRRLARRGR